MEMNEVHYTHGEFNRSEVIFMSLEYVIPLQHTYENLAF